MRGRLKTVARHAGVPLARIGICTRERDITFEGMPAFALPQGFSHFR